MYDPPFWIDLADLVFKTLAVAIGGVWASYKISEHRQFKRWLQLDLDASIFRLNRPELASPLSWDKSGTLVVKDPRTCTHTVEVLLKFTNKGITRARLYNIQVGINTMRPSDEAEFDKGDGHLHLTRIHTSGNVVPEFVVKGRRLPKSSFYYIEPGVEQTVSYLCLIPEPRELIQVFAMFSLEQERLFPTKLVGPTGLYPHTAARTFQLDGHPRPPDERSSD